MTPDTESSLAAYALIIITFGSSLLAILCV